MAKPTQKRQRHSLFDASEVRANFSRACQLPRFDIHESAALLCSLDPDAATGAKIAAFPEHSKAKAYLWAKKVIERSCSPDERERGIAPQRLLEIADLAELTVPAALRAAIEKRKAGSGVLSPSLTELDQLRAENTELRRQLAEPPAKSKRSMQTIMLAAAYEGLGYRGTTNSQIPGEIAETAGDLGLRITQGVVSSHLREAISDLQPEWPAERETSISKAR